MGGALESRLGGLGLNFALDVISTKIIIIIIIFFKNKLY